MAITKTLTPKQLQANQRNALQSTGPKTASGKKASARNALRHGLLASAIIIDRGDGKENAADFAALWQGLRDHFSPDGALEEILVERAAVSYWRLRRALRCETGETRKLLDSAIHDAQEQNEKRFYRDQQFCALDSSGISLRASSRGVGYLTWLIEMARMDVDGKDEISGRVEKLLSHAFGTQPSSPAIWASVYNANLKTAKMAASPVDVESASIESASVESASIESASVESASVESARKQLRDFLDRTHTGLERLESMVKKREDLRLQAQVRSLSLPSPDALDRIVRYETAIERQLYRALDQLERLQRQRKGDPVPPPLKLSLQSE